MQNEAAALEDKSMEDDMLTLAFFKETRKIYTKYFEIAARPVIKYHDQERRAYIMNKNQTAARQEDIDKRQWLRNVTDVLNAHLYAQLNISQEQYENSCDKWLDLTRNDT
jgi:hypothetical protein